MECIPGVLLGAKSSSSWGYMGQREQELRWAWSSGGTYSRHDDSWKLSYVGWGTMAVWRRSAIYRSISHGCYTRSAEPDPDRPKLRIYAIRRPYLVHYHPYGIAGSYTIISLERMCQRRCDLLPPVVTLSNNISSGQK